MVVLLQLLLCHTCCYAVLVLAALVLPLGCRKSVLRLLQRAPGSHLGCPVLIQERLQAGALQRTARCEAGQRGLGGQPAEVQIRNRHKVCVQLSRPSYVKHECDSPGMWQHS
jgi:hypothetical protein